MVAADSTEAESLNPYEEDVLGGAMNKELFIWGIDLSPNLIKIRQSKNHRVFVYLQDANEFAEAMEQTLSVCHGLMASGMWGDKVPSIYLRTPSLTLAGAGRFFTKCTWGAIYGFKLILQDETRIIFQLRNNHEPIDY